MSQLHEHKGHEFQVSAEVLGPKYLGKFMCPICGRMFRNDAESGSEDKAISDAKLMISPHWWAKHRNMDNLDAQIVEDSE